jgi:hypothetical protein
MRYLLATLLTLLALPAFGQATPAGLWRTVDDPTGHEKGLVRIVAENGVLTGRIEKSLDPSEPPHRVCELCNDERKGKPFLGLTILRGRGHPPMERVFGLAGISWTRTMARFTPFVCAP